MCLPILSASAPQKKKKKNWQREKQKKLQDAEHGFPGAMRLLDLTCARVHAGVLDFTTFSNIVKKIKDKNDFSSII